TRSKRDWSSDVCSSDLFFPFYKLVDFDSRLDEKQAARLEEALLRMGILDALIIPQEYREQVLQGTEGVCDRYIFTDARRVKENRSEERRVGEEDRERI